MATYLNRKNAIIYDNWYIVRSEKERGYLQKNLGILVQFICTNLKKPIKSRFFDEKCPSTTLRDRVSLSV